MASTYSDRLKLELMATGANANTWGTNTNNNLEVLDAFAAGYLSKSVAGSANITLSTANASDTAESSNKVIELTGALTGDIVVFIPAVESEYLFFNNTSGSQTLTIAATGHQANGTVITQGAYSRVYCDGASNFNVEVSTSLLGTTTFKDTVTAGGGNILLRTNGAVSATTYTGDGSNLTGVEPFPSGTKQVFYQASAPTGWTQDTASGLSEAVMSVVTGTGGGTGGSTAYFSSFLATTDKSGAQPSAPVTGSVSGTVGPTTLSTPTIASHNHPLSFANSDPDRTEPQDRLTDIGNPDRWNAAQNASGGPNAVTPAGGGGAHSHPFSGSLSGATADVSVTVPAADVKYANVIIAAKD
tara:strand:+ start:914 stop:1984 length:1071 start_codon:yes stop_codon:yes gene_type:complete